MVSGDVQDHHRILPTTRHPAPGCKLSDRQVQ
jgi:hypothetical protein